MAGIHLPATSLRGQSTFPVWGATSAIARIHAWHFISRIDVPPYTAYIPYLSNPGAFAARAAHTATSGRVVGGKHSASTTIVSTGLPVQALRVPVASICFLAFIGAQQLQ